MEKKEIFVSRWGFILAGLGMVVGTGNIWRFPRVVSQYGGGAFIIAWLIFLFLWCIPLLMIEISIGKKTRMGVVGSFGKIAGKNFIWMGSFVAFVPTVITFYYSVVVGWCLKYFFATSFQGLINKDSLRFWQNFASSWQPVIFHLLAILIGCSIIRAGVVKGIERINNIFMPCLFLLLIIACARALSLPGALKGLNFLFSPNISQLADYRIWLNALSQAAWSTGAGWGMMLTYAIYSQKKENPLLTSATLGFGDYVASLLAAMAVIPTVFSYFSSQNLSKEKVMEVMSTDNQGLTFIWIPQLFTKIPAGSLFLALFFLALCFAAFTSLISQLELIVRILIDGGLVRKKAVLMVGIVCFVMGIPSAISMGFFNNQDWVWGLGLMLSGFFFTFAVLKYGPGKFRREVISSEDKIIKLESGFDILIKFFLPVQVVAMLGWWFYTSYSSNPTNWHKIFVSSSVGTVLFQWVVALGIFIILNKTIHNKMIGER